MDTFTTTQTTKRIGLVYVHEDMFGTFTDLARTVGPQHKAFWFAKLSKTKSQKMSPIVKGMINFSQHKKCMQTGNERI